MIDILLSTYNGEKYLASQLDSILNQTHTEWRLIVRDDSSSDSTPIILDLYQKKYPDKIIIIPNNINQNLGVIKSFELLLTQSSNDYIMFCDQDDIWLPNKIKESIETITLLEKTNPNTPILIHSDLHIINKNEQITHDSLWQYAGIKPEILNCNPKYMAFCNSVTGCTILMNKQCKSEVLPFPNNIVMHDAWIALKICQIGIVHHINKQLILYRQHDNNTLGINKYKFSIADRIKKLKTTYINTIEVYKHYPFIFNNKLDFWIHKIKYLFKHNI